jgi:EAL domain-containing protein (putative c-di-GMP-specific phosphodiesterase class I)
MLIAREDEPNRFTLVRQAESVRDAHGVHQRWEITQHWSDEQLAAVGLFRVQEIQGPKGRTVIGFHIERIDGVVQQVLELGNVVDDLINYAALVRWQTETAGMLTSLGFGVLTDRESQGMINGAYAFLMSNPERTVHWKKSATEFIELDHDQMERLAIDVAEHVQHCFAVERNVIERIIGGEITEAEQIDEEFAQPATLERLHPPGELRPPGQQKDSE